MAKTLRTDAALLRSCASTEPPGYGVILVGTDGVVVNYRDMAA